ncbi:PRD domain-containing protein [Enterococcus olivae]
MKLSEEAKQLIDNSKYSDELQTVIFYTEKATRERNIFPTELQWTVLINHLNEMIRREREVDAIPAVDPEMFAEVSSEALEIADGVVKAVGQLPIDEMYVLSIHFESAKQN